MSRSRSAATRLRPVALAMVLGLVVAACLSPAESPTPTPVPATPGPTPTPAATAQASPTGDAGRVDLTLLSIFPLVIDGVELRPAPEATQQVLDRVDFTRDIDRLAYAVAAVPAEGEVSVVAIAAFDRGQFNEDFFRDFRTTFIAEVCSPSGGPGGVAQTEIDGREVWLSSCANGGIIYHLHLAGPDRIVSVTSVGERRLGEQIVRSLDEG